MAARLRATFITELEEQVAAMSASVLALERAPTDAAQLNAVFRVAHTLKGAARAVGIGPVERACHHLESLLAQIRSGRISLRPEHVRLLLESVDALADVGRRLRGGEDLDGAPITQLEQRLAAGDAAGKTVDGGRAAATAPPAADRSDRARATPGSVPATPARRSAAPGAAQVRVAADKLDRLLYTTEELRILAGQLQVDAADAEALEDSLARALRPRDELLAHASRVARASREASRSVARLSDTVAASAHRLRMRPFLDVCDALPRAVRDIGSSQGKPVRLVLEGGDVEADRGVLDTLREPLLHLVRNAVDHGIEAPERRRGARKADVGTITVGATVRGDRLVVTVADDGGGVDTDVLREQLRAGGHVDISDQALGRWLFESGISSRTVASEISGRGVGLDVVRSAIEGIGGSVSVGWVRGSGTTFTLECPITLSAIRAVVLKVGATHVAVPTAHVLRLARYRPADVKRAGGRDFLSVAGESVPVVALARTFGSAFTRAATGEAACVVLLDASGEQLAVIADEAVTESELTVRRIDGGAHGGVLTAGAALLASGTVAPVLNVAALVAAARVRSAEAPASPVSSTRRLRILVIDDSVTARALEQGLLEAAGYDVLTAADGAAGLRLLDDRGADLVISDVEMPEMDGFSLCRAVRATPRFATLPVILLTGLETEADRARGLAAGADAYLAKSTFDQRTLLDVVRQFLD